MGTRKTTQLSEISIPVGTSDPAYKKNQMPKDTHKHSNKNVLERYCMYLFVINYSVLPCIKISCTFWSFTQLFTSSWSCGLSLRTGLKLSTSSCVKTTTITHVSNQFFLMRHDISNFLLRVSFFFFLPISAIFLLRFVCLVVSSIPQETWWKYKARKKPFCFGVLQQIQEITYAYP